MAGKKQQAVKKKDPTTTATIEEGEGATTTPSMLAKRKQGAAGPAEGASSSSNNKNKRKMAASAVATAATARRSTRSRAPTSTNKKVKKEDSEEEEGEEEEEEEEEESSESEAESEASSHEDGTKPPPRQASFQPNPTSTASMSAFERERMENIRRNQEVLRALGLGDTKAQIGLTSAAARLKQPAKKKPTVRGVKKDAASKEPRMGTRKSARMEGKDAPFYNEEKMIMEVEAQFAKQEEEKRMDEGPLTLETLNRTEEGGAEFLGLLKKLIEERDATAADGDGGGKESASASASAGGGNTSGAKPDMDYVERLAALSLAEDDIVKLTPSRCTSMVVHPSEQTLVVVAADVDGYLGVWQVDKPASEDDGQAGVFKFRPHIAKVASMQYHPQDASKLISASHDGTVRCLDLEKQVFDLLVATDEKFTDSGFTCASLAGHSPHNLYLAGHEGSTGMLDIRSRTLGWVNDSAHGKKVNSIEAHPTREHLFVSSSTDRAVILWDDRKPKKEVWSIAHTNSINNATFNPTGAQLLITCQDHKLYVHDDPVASPPDPPEFTSARYKIKHNNNTGRWLSKFWPTWDPKNPDAFVIGSLEQPRRIEVYSASSGFQIASVRSEWMNSVQSINAFHPTRNILVGANSSGRVHLYRGP